MNGTDGDLESLVALIKAGQLDEVRSRMLTSWRPSTFWDRRDVAGLAMLLHGIKQLHGEQATQFYQPYAEQFKAHSDDLEWLMSLQARAGIVEVYEGPLEAIAWLKSLSGKIAEPDGGFVDLSIADILMHQNEFTAAREHLSRAVNWSLAGLGWYRLEALQAMFNCLLTLGENRLAFEYGRTHIIESYKIGEIRQERDLFDAVHGLSLRFGQIDYVVDVKKNVALRAFEEGNYPVAALEESEAGLRLAQIGASDEWVVTLRQAAQYAERGSRPCDLGFAWTCRLLARYLDRLPLERREIDAMFEAASSRVIRSQKAAFSSMRKNVRDDTAPNVQLLNEWQSACESCHIDAPLTGDNSEAKSRDTLVQLTAVLARFYAEKGDAATCHSFYAIVTGIQAAGEAIYVIARHNYVESLLATGKLKTAVQVEELVLHRVSRMPHERFVSRQLAARCYLALELKKEAYSWAKLALSDWKLVLAGLYSEKHKVDWLRYGTACLSCAIDAIRSPVDWMPESQRYRELLGLMEFGKARLVFCQVRTAG